MTSWGGGWKEWSDLLTPPSSTSLCSRPIFLWTKHQEHLLCRLSGSGKTGNLVDSLRGGSCAVGDRRPLACKIWRGRLWLLGVDHLYTPSPSFEHATDAKHQYATRTVSLRWRDPSIWTGTASLPRAGIPGPRFGTSSVKQNFIIILIKCSLIYLIHSFYNQPMLNLWSFYIQPVTNVNSILSIDTIHEFERIISLPLRNPATISLFYLTDQFFLQKSWHSFSSGAIAICKKSHILAKQFIKGKWGEVWPCKTLLSPEQVIDIQNDLNGTFKGRSRYRTLSRIKNCVTSWNDFMTHGKCVTRAVLKEDLAKGRISSFHATD